MNEEIFNYDDSIEGIKSNVIEKGRYRFKTMDIYKKTSDNGNALAIVTLEIWDVDKTQRKGQIKRSLMTEKVQKMSFLWHNFLFSIGIRSKGVINIPKEKLIGSEGLIDLGLEKNRNEPSLEQNRILNFSPIEQATAPIPGVPATTKKPEEKGKEKTEEKTKEDNVDVGDL